ncbi:LsmAD domain [Dillenia turbinata]|uniref:LsmAD domain n=1 Tax=Dillenia turbinata TaxID=194707 RepID=A0AAN8YTE0_9MAGN
MSQFLEGVYVTRDGLTNEFQCEKRQDIMIDAFISQSRKVDVERELERWVPDEDDPQWPESENIFDGHWNRSWDQFETNEALFGVKSTFNEELYTTKLERGPHMRGLEEEASRIAREIQGEETQDLHIAEDDAQSSQCGTGQDLLRSNSNDCAKEVLSELPRGLTTVATESRVQDNQFTEDQGLKYSSKDFVEKQTVSGKIESSGNARTSKSEEFGKLHYPLLILTIIQSLAQ